MMLLLAASLLATPPPAPPATASFRSTASGERLRPIPPPNFRKARAKGAVIEVRPEEPLQSLEGMGAALTEASAFVLAHLPQPKRAAILDHCFGPGGANFSMTRIPIGACDFSVTGRWSYADTPEDTELAHFTLEPDRRGWSTAQDPDFSLRSLIREALRRRPDLKFVASPWTAPAWMKDNGAWYGDGKGGRLRPEHYGTFARYMVKYLEGYRSEGVAIWAVTPVNEPGGNGGQWESMEFTPESLRDYIGAHLGPALAASGFGAVKILTFDHNRDQDALRFAETVLGDPRATAYVYGTALHWYSTTFSACPEILDALRDRYPGKALIHTEGCIDAIGTEDASPGGRFRGWKNPRWWWQESATDWGYHWAPEAERPAHPRYAPVDRYARDIIDGLKHGLSGWIDWNLVLDSRGGPNHVRNFCAAPIMAEPTTGEVFFTPLWDVLMHFSRDVQPGAHLLVVQANVPGCSPDDLHATAIQSPDGRVSVFVFNRASREIRCNLQVGDHTAPLRLPARSLQTLRLSNRLLLKTPDAPTASQN